MTLKNIRLRQRNPAALTDPVAPPNKFPEFILQGICPWCGRGPFVVLAGHTSRVHGINRFELREIAGVFYSTTLTSPKYHAERSAASKAAYDRGEILTKNVGVKGVKHRLSPAAVELQGEKARSRSAGSRAAVGRALSAKRRAETKTRDEAIVAGALEGRTNADLGREYGLRSNTIRDILKRRGHDIDARSRYGDSLRGRAIVGFEEGRAALSAANAERRARIVQRWTDGESVEDLAADLEVSAKHVRNLLRIEKAPVPDGRKNPKPRPPRPRAPTRYCEIEGCDRVHCARGLCGLHYQRGVARAKKARSAAVAPAATLPEEETPE